MRREDFTLDVSDEEWVEADGEPRRPTVTIDFEGDRDALRERFAGPDGEYPSGDHIDVTLRLRGDPDDPETAGVVAVTDRVTGALIFELDERAVDVLDFVDTARAYGERSGDDGGYRVVVAVEGDPVVTYEKETFLVYSEDGDLLRGRSLIPGGVEL